MVCEKLIPSHLVTPNDVTHAHKVFGFDLTGLRDKTMRRDPTRFSPQYVEIPKEIIEQNKMVTLTADIIFVNQISCHHLWKRSCFNNGG